MSLQDISDKELIEKFLRGELQEEEKLVFDVRKKEAAFMQLLEEAIISYQGRLELKKQLQKIGSEITSESHKSNRSSFAWISGIAASVLLLFGIYFFNSTELSTSELFDTYFEAYPNAYTIKGNTTDESLSKKAFNFYDTANYQDAITTFEEITAKRALNSSEHFYYGISLLSVEATEKAKHQFKQVTAAHPLYNEAQWYTSLSLIKQDSVSKAKAILNNTELQFSTNRKKNVKDLLDQLP